MGFFNDVNPQSVSQAPDGFKEFRVGDNEASIVKVEEAISNSSNPMLVVTFRNNDGAEIRYYIVDGEYKLQRLKQLYLSFGVPIGSTDTNSWIGKTGIVVCKAGEPYEGKIYNKVSYLKPKAPGTKSEQSVSAPASQVEPFNDDIPF